MKRPAHHIDCTRCESTGHHALSDYQVATLRAFLSAPAAPGPRTTSEIVKLARIGGTAPQTAATNRLNALRALGFVTRENRNGRAYTWSLTDAGYAATRSAP